MGCLAIDPGELKKVGWAIVDPDGELLDWGVGVPPPYKGQTVVEYPEYFRKGSPTAMIRLALRAGLLAASTGSRDIFALPVSVWTRRIPKKVRHERLLRSHPELAKLNEHVLDAVAIAKWWAARPEKERRRFRCQIFGRT